MTSLAVAGQALSLLIAATPAQPGTDSVVAWARRAAMPITTFDLDGDQADLAPLASLVGGARVVGSGESAHHIHEFLLLRTRILRYLVEQLGFTALTMETGFAEAARLDRWIAGEHDQPDFVGGLPFARDGEYAEFRAALRWLRRHNATVEPSRRVRFYGIDLSHGGGAVTPTLNELWGYLERVDSGASQPWRARLDPLAARIGIGPPQNASRRFDSLGAAAQTDLRAGLDDLARHLVRRRRAYLGRSSERDYRFAARLVEVARQTVAFMSDDPYSPTNARDTAMAANVRWVLEQEGARGRVVVWAHNAHVQRVPIDLPGVTTAPATSMGQRLSQALGAGYRALGTAMGRAPGDSADADPATIDGILTRVGRPTFLVSLGAPSSPLVRRWLTAPQRMRFPGPDLRLVPAVAFDALIFVDRTTPATRVPEGER
jgi:erythromycin esterase